MTIKRRTLLLLASAAAATKAYGQVNVFTYFGTPTLTSITPVATGPVTGGTPVTINGNNFTLASQVTFANVPTPFTIVSNTQITCNTPVVPAGTTTASVLVTTPGGVNAGNTAFTYTPVVVGNVPVVTAVYPNAGGGGTFAAIVGTGFTGATSVTVDSVTPVLSFTVVSDTQIDAYMPFHSAAARQVIVRNSSGPSTNNVTFTHGVPEVAALPVIPADGSLPNIFAFGPLTASNGTAVTTTAQWELKKREIQEAMFAYGEGHVPPPSPVVFVSTAVDQVLTTVGVGTMRNLQVNLQTAVETGTPINFVMNFYIPLNHGAAGTLFPCIMSGEMAWSPLIAQPAQLLDAGLGQTNLNVCVNRGYVICEMNRDNFSLDNMDTNPVEGIFSSPAYTSYPFDRNSGPAVNFPSLGVTSGLDASANAGCGGLIGYDSSSHGWWTWGFMRCVDYMMTLHGNSNNAFNFIDPNKVALTGISRGSGPPLTAAAYDKRVAVSLPNQGLGIWGVSRYTPDSEGSTGGVNPANVPGGPIIGGQPNPSQNPRYLSGWIGPAVVPLNHLFPSGQGQSVYQGWARLPAENSDLMAMIAPRGFCNFGVVAPGQIDGPRSAKQKFFAGRTAWSALGANPVTAMFHFNNNTAFASNGHSMLFDAWTNMIDYCVWYYANQTALNAGGAPATPFPTADNLSTTSGQMNIWCSSPADFANPAKGTSVTGSPYFGSANDPAFTWIPPSSLIGGGGGGGGSISAPVALINVGSGNLPSGLGPWTANSGVAAPISTSVNSAAADGNTLVIVPLVTGTVQGQTIQTLNDSANNSYTVRNATVSAGLYTQAIAYAVISNPINPGTTFTATTTGGAQWAIEGAWKIVGAIGGLGPVQSSFSTSTVNTATLSLTTTQPNTIVIGFNYTHGTGSGLNIYNPTTGFTNLWNDDIVDINYNIVGAAGTVTWTASWTGPAKTYNSLLISFIS